MVYLELKSPREHEVTAMSMTVFQDRIFPRHVSDLMNLMHMVVFHGTDGDESWESLLELKQKEYVSPGLAEYYQCEHCIEHHMAALCKLESVTPAVLTKNINAMILFLRIDTRTIGKAEKQHWISSWTRFAHRLAMESNDELMPYLMGLAIGIARDDDFLIAFCGEEVKKVTADKGMDLRAVIGELESVVVFMKAAVSKNRVARKIDALCK